MVQKTVFTANAIIKPLSPDLSDLILRAMRQNAIFRTILNHLHVHTRVLFCVIHMPSECYCKQVLILEQPSYRTHETLHIPHVFTISI